MTVATTDPAPGAAVSANREVAERLRHAAALLAQQGANPFRGGAYRRAAEFVSRLDRDLRDLLAQEGLDGLVALPHIGRGIARAIVEILPTRTRRAPTSSGAPRTGSSCTATMTTTRRASIPS
jgi:DNA polymerase/3'-5' exonuclease PolX